MRKLIFGLASLLAVLSTCSVSVAIAQTQDNTTQTSTEAKAKPRRVKATTVRHKRVYRRYRHAGYQRYEYCPTCERAVNHSGCGYYNCYPPRERECGDSHCGRALLLDEDANLVDEVLLKGFAYACDDCEAIRY